MGDLPYEGRLFKDVLDKVYAGNQLHGVEEHILLQFVRGPC